MYNKSVNIHTCTNKVAVNGYRGDLPGVLYAFNHQHVQISVFFPPSKQAVQMSCIRAWDECTAKRPSEDTMVYTAIIN